MHSLLDPAIMFFLLGILAGSVKSNLKIPAPIAKFLALYLLMAVGLKGGFALDKSGLAASVVVPLLACVAMAFVVAKDTSALGDAAARLKLEGEIMKLVDSQLGAVARPSRVLFVSLLPKTRSGKLLRRAIQAVCEKRDPGDLTTIDDPSLLQQIKEQLA